MSNTTSSSSSIWIRRLIPLIIFAFACGVFYFLKSTKPQAPSKKIEEKVWSVKTISAEPSIHQPNLVLYGKVESPRMTHITAAVTAFVEQVDTDEGKNIALDEALIQLDSSDAQLLVAQRQADVDSFKAQIDAEKIRYQTDQKSLAIEQKLQQLSLKAVTRYQNLIKRKVSSQDQLDSARSAYHQQTLAVTQREQAIADHPNRLAQLESQLKRATSLLDAAILDLDRTAIKAPFIGRVARLHVAPGDRVRAGDPLLDLYSTDRLEVRAQIPNRVLANLRNREINSVIQATAQLDGQTLKLELDRIAAEVDGGRAGVDALFKITDKQNVPEPGRSLAIAVELPAVEQTIALPPMALYGLNRIYLLKDGRMQGLDVERIGDSSDQQGKPVVLIRSTQLVSGDQIITTQLPNAISGLRVKDVNAPEVVASTGAKDE
ncbi:efflux RND transporter periplasmic adaptor subunit [Neptuniibacter sp. QD37_6]|uniref:efflux RND transporter periplasmic adaptor subunit n=1 Tax=Neptuniibacter sp. QD37_6 TaxID=3398210 RepID=UPI0039F51A0A